MSDQNLRVAIIGCGRLGQSYANIYSSLPDTEIVAFVETNPNRLASVGEFFGVKALFIDTDSMLRELTPDIVAVVTPTKYYRDSVVACAQAGVKGVSTDKPSAATLSDADDMVRECQERGVVLSGGALMRARPELQEAAGWLRAGDFGPLIGASVQSWSGEISGSGCHTISVLRLLADAEVEEVIGWAEPHDILESDCDWGLTVNAFFKLSNGLACPAYGNGTENAGLVQVWTEEALVRMGWEAPEIWRGFDESGNRKKADIQYSDHGWSESAHLHGAIRSFINAVKKGGELWISGHDLRQALEVAIASQVSAKRGSVPMKLPLEDRSLTLFPRPYRWLGGDEYTTEGEKVEGRRKDLDV
jgi:predicted dehydrogenase